MLNCLEVCTAYDPTRGKLVRVFVWPVDLGTWLLAEFFAIDLNRGWVCFESVGRRQRQVLEVKDEEGCFDEAREEKDDLDPRQIPEDPR